MKYLFNLLTAMSISIVSLAQNTGKVTGSIKDGGNQKIIDAATISLLKSKDSSLVKTAITDKEGNFIFENLKEGNYFVSASSLGHSKVYSNLFALTQEQSNINVGVLQLVPVNENLKEVVVTSKKPFIERKLDRTIVNVDASISNAGSSAMEVLEKSPGITIDKDGNISLKGKQGVKVFIDGKPSYLSGPDLANLLKSMGSAQLDQIEIMTNPPAKYDAAGNAGIINIKTKKNKTVGYNGSISSSVTQGKYTRTNESINLNYRNKNINVFGNYSFRHDKNYSDLTILRKFRDKNSKELLSIFDQQSKFTNDNNSNNAKLGIDVNVSKKTTVGVVASGFINTEKFDNNNITLLKSGMDITDSSTFANTEMNNKWKNFSGNFNLRHVFDTTGRELTFDADYIRYTQNSSQSLANQYFDAAIKRTLPMIH